MKRKLLFLAAFVASALGMRAQTEWTGDITNANGLSFTTKYVDPSSHDVAETWTSTSSTTHAFDVNQSLTSVPDGVYELSAQAMYRASLTYGTATNCVLYATVGERTFSTPIANFGDYTAKEDRAQIGTQMKNNNAYLNVVPAVIVEGGNVTIGMKSVGELAYCTNGYWFVYKKSTFTFKNVTESYHAKLIARANTILATAPASDEKTTLSNALTTYATANLANVKALQTAINTFLETATVTNPLNVTDYIANPSFEDTSGNKKNWIQDLGYKQPDDIYQPTSWNMLYSSAKVDNAKYQTYNTQTDNAKNGNCYYVRHRWGDVYAVVSLHQLVKELPAGAYQLQVAVKGGSSVTDANTLMMTAGANTNTTTVSDFDKSNYKDYSVQVIKADAISDIDISFGWNQTTGNEQKYYVDDFRLYYLGDPVKAKKKELEDLQATIDDTYLNAASYNNIVGTERTNLTAAKTVTAAEETVSAYETTIAAVQDAIDKFIVAKTNYDALVVEIDKAKALGIAAATADTYAATASSTAATALTSTQNLKVAEYNYVTTNYAHSVSLGEWTSTGINTSAATFSNEHWSGTTHEYKNQNDNNGQGWNASSWSINFSQNVTLPAGNYVFKVAGRQASGDAVNTSLVVTKTSDSSVLGTVSDFPRSNNSRGINKSGATAFEGENDVFANSGNGYGWEWRYVKFTLASDETVNIAINSVATASHQWVSFGDYTLETDNEANISLIAYNIALNDAITARDNATYNNIVVGTTERDELIAAITADGTLDKSNKTAIDAAKDVLVAKTTAFTGAKSAYDTWAATKVIDYEDNLPYASSTKFAAIATAQGATPTTAAAATTATTAVLSAYRLYVESNAMAEGLAGAEDKTSLIANPNFADVTISGTTAGGWTFDQTGGTVMIRPSSEQPLTDGTGSSDYSYFDYNNNSNNNQNIHQIINLEPGRYLLTAAGRGATNFSGNLQLYAVGKGDVKIPAIGNDNGAFGRGWNDATLEFGVSETADITIGVKTNNSKSGWWSATRFRLVKLPIPDVAISEEAIVAPSPAVIANVTLTRTLKGGQWNGFSVPFGFTVAGSALDGAQVKKFSSVTGNEITLEDATEIVAGEPYLVKPTADVVNPTFNGVTVTAATDVVKGTGDYKFASHLYNTALATDGSVAYVSTTDSSIKKLTSGSIKGLRAIFNIPTGAEAKALVVDFGEGTTGILNVDAEGNIYEGQIYNLSGQRVNMIQKGIYIVNGKKVLIK